MFDGKHITRRAINLGSSSSSSSRQQHGGNSSSSHNNNSYDKVSSTAGKIVASYTIGTTTTTTTFSVLKEAQQKREERQIYLKGNKAAINIQRMVRGYFTVKQVCRNLDSSILSSLFLLLLQFVAVMIHHCNKLKKKKEK